MMVCRKGLVKFICKCSSVKTTMATVRAPITSFVAFICTKLTVYLLSVDDFVARSDTGSQIAD